jgi:hypothetical protein
MSVNVKFSIGVLLGILIAVIWYESRNRKMG